MHLNHITIMGRLTADPEVQSTRKDNVPVCRFSIAVDRPKRRDMAENKTDFFNCVAWNGTAKLLENYFHKGERILVEGSLRNRTYLDKMEEKRTVAEIHVDKVFFIEKKSDSEQEADLEELF